MQGLVGHIRALELGGEDGEEPLEDDDDVWFPDIASE